MPLHSTDDISDESIASIITDINNVYKSIMGLVFSQAKPQSQKRAEGMVDNCCDKEQMTLLIRLVRILMENYKTIDGNRLPIGYAVAAIVYYYYQLELIESNVTSFLDLALLPHLYIITPQQISNIHYVVNFLITSDEPYVSQIRRAMMNLNGGRKRKGKRKSLKKARGSKIGTRYRRK